MLTGNSFTIFLDSNRQYYQSGMSMDLRLVIRQLFKCFTNYYFKNNRISQTSLFSLLMDRKLDKEFVEYTGIYGMLVDL